MVQRVGGDTFRSRLPLGRLEPEQRPCQPVGDRVERQAEADAARQHGLAPVEDCRVGNPGQRRERQVRALNRHLLGRAWQRGGIGRADPDPPNGGASEIGEFGWLAALPLARDDGRGDRRPRDEAARDRASQSPAAFRHSLSAPDPLQAPLARMWSSGSETDRFPARAQRPNRLARPGRMRSALPEEMASRAPSNAGKSRIWSVAVFMSVKAL